MLSRYCLWPIIAAAALAVLGGCSPTVRWPNLYHPGTAQQQRAEALVHDPYPLDDAGPEIVGGRPVGYQRPVLEVERARMFFSNLPGAGRVPTQLAPLPPAQPVPSPYVSPPSAPAVPYPYGPPPSSQPARR